MKIHQLQGYIQTIYVIEYPDKILVFDSGCKVDVHLIHTFIVNDLKRNFSDVLLVAVSHIHPDHAGGANGLKRNFKIKVAAPRGINNWYKGIKGIKDYIIDVLLTHYVAIKMKKKFEWLVSGRIVNADYFLNDGDRLPGFEDWQVIKTSGHTDSDLSFYHNETSTVYVGDVIIKVRGRYIHPHPVSFPIQYRSTLKKLSDEKFVTYLLAHGGQNQIKKEDIDKILSTVSDTPVTNKQILKQVLGNYRKNKKL
jgi:glyoxylase-like metal-dependent hydrolase (beta-lactamase superfamily II)